MAGFGLPDFKSPVSPLSGAGVTNTSTRDFSAPDNLKMEIVPVNEPYNSNNTLLLNTSSVSETKASNWVKHYVPGQSDPLLQWINGSERTISFTAFVTKDIASNPTVNEVANSDQWTLVISPELEARYKNADTVPALTLNNATNAAFKRLTNKVYPQWSRSIQPQLDFYRSLVLPREGISSTFSKTPPLVYLRMGTILGNRADIEKQKYILLNYSMNITEFSPELEPTKATVTFTFVEYVARSKTSTPQQDTNSQLINKAKIDNAGPKIRSLGAVAQQGTEA